MKVSYYPGCTLRTTARELDRCARESALRLGFELCEIENWQCCGGAFTSARDEIATKLAAVRALRAARDAGQPLVTVCSACYNVLQRTNEMLRGDAELTARVNRYLAQDGDGAAPYAGEAQVYHYLQYLRDTVGFDAVRAAVVKPLTGQRVAAYYGCLLLRPSKELRLDDPENPTVMEQFIRALGGEPVVYPQRNECCGGYMAVEDPAAAARRGAAVTHSAAAHGADVIVTACPLCRYNLIKSGSEVPVLYFTELLAQALGVKEENDG